MNRSLSDNYKTKAESRVQEIYNHFINLAINRFSWEGLPYGLTSEQMEFLLLTHGQLIFYNNDKYGNTILPCHGTTDINVYGLPTEYEVTSENGFFTDTVSFDDGVIIRNNPLGTNDDDNLLIYAERIDNIERTQDVNIFQQNIPKIVLGDKDSELTMKNIINKIKEFNFVIFGKKTLKNNIKTTDVLDTSAPYVTDKLQIQKESLMNEVLTFLGIENANTQKRERLVTDEVNANNQFTNINLDLMFDLRKQACKEIKEKFGVTITVKKREVEENSRTHIKPKDNN